MLETVSKTQSSQFSGQGNSDPSGARFTPLSSGSSNRSATSSAAPSFDKAMAGLDEFTNNLSNGVQQLASPFEAPPAANGQVSLQQANRSGSGASSVSSAQDTAEGSGKTQPSLSISITSIRIGGAGQGNPSAGSSAQDRDASNGSQKSFDKGSATDPNALLAQPANPLMALVLMLLGLIANILPAMMGQGAQSKATG